MEELHEASKWPAVCFGDVASQRKQRLMQDRSLSERSGRPSRPTKVRLIEIATFSLSFKGRQLRSSGTPIVSTRMDLDTRSRVSSLHAAVRLPGLGTRKVHPDMRLVYKPYEKKITLSQNQLTAIFKVLI